MSTSPTGLRSRTRNFSPTHTDTGAYSRHNKSSGSNLSPNKQSIPTQKTETSNLKYSFSGSDNSVVGSDSKFNFGSNKTIVTDSNELTLGKTLPQKTTSKVSLILKSIKDLAILIPSHLLGKNQSPEVLNNKIQEILSKLFGEAPLKEQIKPIISSQDPEKVGGRPIIANNIGHEIPPPSNAYAPENTSYGNHAQLQATPGVHSGNTGQYQPADIVSGNQAGHHGSADSKNLHLDTDKKANDGIEDIIKRLSSALNDDKSKGNPTENLRWGRGHKKTN